MASKVIYKQGTKATYLSLETRNPYALYFCTDTRELFRGNDLFSDGMRLVDSADKLPAMSVAADGILYFCTDSGCGYVLNETRDGWIPVVYGVDNETIGVNENGLMYVKSIPVELVGEIVEDVKQVASTDSVGMVKPSDEIAVAEDGSMTITEVPMEKVPGLADRLQNIEQSIIDGPGLVPNEEQFEVDEGNVLNLTAVEAAIVRVGEKDLNQALAELAESIANASGTLTWQDM